MATICREHQLLFIMTPLTGCSATSKALRDHLGGDWFPPEPVVNENGKLLVRRKHCALGELLKHRVLSREDAGQLFKFTTVRNPFDYLVSKFVKRKYRFQRRVQVAKRFEGLEDVVEDVEYCRDHDFDDWIARHYAVGRLDRMRGLGRRNGILRFSAGVDAVMRYERLDDEFQRVLREAGVSTQVRIPRYHATPGKKRDYRSYYSPRSRRIIEYAYQDVLARFDFAF